MKIIGSTDFPLEKTKVEIDPGLTASLKTETEPESQVIVHLSNTARMYFWKIRIWRSTYLICKETEHKSKLLHAENISVFPEWTPIPYGETLHFTLIFEGLPRDCRVFTLHEQIPESGGFLFENIARNNTDVYYISI